MKKNKVENAMSFFERYLSLWVGLCIVLGVFIGHTFPTFPKTLAQFEYASVSIPIAILIWLMIFPMMLKVDFSSIVRATKQPKGLIITCVVNWLIKPFTMYLIAAGCLTAFSFFGIIPENLATEYLAGAILLGAAPCTAMVFVWSHLTKGDAAYTVIQVAVNDLILLFAFTPIVAVLLGMSNVFVPYDTLFLSVVLFVVIPLFLGVVVRKYIIHHRGEEYFNTVFVKKFDKTTIMGLLTTLVIIFSFQGELILANPGHILLIAIPLIVQTVFIFLIGYGWSFLWKLPHSIAAPASLIGASNFFELAVAVAISLFGLNSGATLATVVGVLVEVPIMLTLVKFVNKTRISYTQKINEK